MKKLILSSVVLCVFSISMILFQFSCSKNTIAQTNTPVKYTIEGLWAGTYLSNGSSLSQFISLSIKQDGNFICDSKGAGNQYLSVGTWNLSGTNFTADLTNVWSQIGSTNISQHFTATYDSTTGKIANGTWTNTTLFSGTGTFDVTEVN